MDTTVFPFVSEFLADEDLSGARGGVRGSDAGGLTRLGLAAPGGRAR
ncbi:MAG: hypothetical protein ACP5G2_07590 [Candidatus Bipolaricaulaceae bacterium]